MPKLWTDTIEAHRNAVREAALDATAALVSECGLLSVTMSKVAERSGIGRATLYKYFPDVESIMAAWHEHQISAHLEELAEARDQADGSGARLQAVLAAYARVMHAQRRDHGSEIAAMLHQGEHVTRAHDRLVGMVRDLIADAADSGDLRTDADPDELARYCLHALGAATALSSDAAVDRLIAITLTGLGMEATTATAARRTSLAAAHGSRHRHGSGHRHG